MIAADEPTACATYPHKFDDEYGSQDNANRWRERNDDLRWLRATCAACPVLEQCRALVLNLDVGGFVAGMTERERRKARAELRLARGAAAYLPPAVSA